jgi:rhomboid protease GluP
MMPKLSFKLPQQKIFLLLVLANIAVYVWQAFSGVDWMRPELADMIKWGANVAPLTMQGEPWRLFTSMFLHSGFVHIALNMYMLILCGRFVERAYGSLNFSIIYFISGLFGSLASATWYAQHKVQSINVFLPYPVATEQLQMVVSVGASGALMGITGAYLAHWLVDEFRQKTHAESSGIYAAFAQILAINLVMGFITTGVDNACHVGGLLSGAIVGGVLAITQDGAGFAKRFGIGLAVSFLSLFLLFKGTQIPASDELKDLKTQILSELESMQKEQVLDKQKVLMDAEKAKEKATAAAEIAEDAKHEPTPVDAKTAAGESILIGQYINDMRLSRDGKRLYLVSDSENSLKIVDLENKKVVNTILGGAFGGRNKSDCSSNKCEGWGADSMALSPDEHFAYVSSMSPDAVAVIDLTQNKVVATIAVGRFPRPIVVSKNGQRGYVLNGVDNTISVLDLSNNSVIGSPITLDDGANAEGQPFGRPVGLWLANDDAQLWVTNATSNQLSVIDTKTLKITNSVALSEDNWFRAGASTAKQPLWLMGNNGLVAMNLQTQSLVKSIPFCITVDSYGMETSPDNRVLAISDRRGYLRLVKPSTRKTIGIYPVSAPDTVLFSADAKQLYVANNNTDFTTNAATQSLVILNVKNTLDVSKDVAKEDALCQLE